VHRWWYRQAQAAGLVGPGVTSGLNMHQARHTFAMELRRVAGIDAASTRSATRPVDDARDLRPPRRLDLERAMEPTPPGARTSKRSPRKGLRNADG
jgi:integrase